MPVAAKIVVHIVHGDEQDVQLFGLGSPAMEVHGCEARNDQQKRTEKTDEHNFGSLSEIHLNRDKLGQGI